MSRTKYSPEKQKAIMAIFIEAASEIIASEGMNGISIRSVSAKAGYSSATLYLYFRDINQLIAMASIGNLRMYISELARDIAADASPKEQYVKTWEIFCKHSFRKASIFMHLFFDENPDFLNEIVKKYYSIFPNELEEISPNALSMLMAGNLFERNFNILKLYAAEKDISMDQARIINDLTVCYYRKFLEEACTKNNLSEEEADAYTKKFMEGVNFLVP